MEMTAMTEMAGAAGRAGQEKDMTILVIDTAGATASVSIIEESGRIFTETSSDTMSHLQLLMPMVSRVLEKAGVGRAQITHIAAAVGPGSFTGIRIGLATAKTLAQAWKLPMIAVSSLAAFSYEEEMETGTAVFPMLDARHGQVFAAGYRSAKGSLAGAFCSDGGRGSVAAAPAERSFACGGKEGSEITALPQALMPEGLYDAVALIGSAAEAAGRESGIREICFCGDGAARYAEEILRAEDRRKAAGGGLPALRLSASATVEFAGTAAAAATEETSGTAETAVSVEETAAMAGPESSAAESYAAAVAQMALHMASLGETVSYREIQPVYLRKSEAERKLAAKELGKKKHSASKQEVVIFEMPPEDETITFRRVSVSDAAELAKLDALCFSNPWSEASFAGEFDGSRESFYMAAENSRREIIGFAGIVSVLDEGEVNRVAVHPLYRGRKIAEALMRHILEGAEERGVTTQLLEVREANRTAIALYKNLGFRVTGKREGYYAETGENALMMRRDCGASDEADGE